MAVFAVVTPLFIVAHGRSDHPQVDISSDPVVDTYTTLTLPLPAVYLTCRRENICVPTFPEYTISSDDE